MGNSKRFILSFDCNINDRSKFLKIIDDQLCSVDDLKNNKYLTWIRYLNNTYFLFTSNDTILDQNKISQEIHKYCKSESLDVSYVILEINNVSGYMPDKFWKSWENYKDINQYSIDCKRHKKLKKLKEILQQNELIKKKQEEFKKEQERMNILLELKRKEEDLKRKEEDLNNKINKQKNWLYKLLNI